MIAPTRALATIWRLLSIDKYSWTNHLINFHLGHAKLTSNFTLCFLHLFWEGWQWCEVGPECSESSCNIMSLASIIDKFDMESTYRNALKHCLEYVLSNKYMRGVEKADTNNMHTYVTIWYSNCNRLREELFLHQHKMNKANGELERKKRSSTWCTSLYCLSLKYVFLTVMPAISNTENYTKCRQVCIFSTRNHGC